MKRIFFLIFIVCFTLTSSANGPGNSDDSTNVYFKYSLSELLNTKITVASKDEEKANEAPAFTVNYTNDDIQHFGYYTLGSLANITSGYSQDHTLYGEYGFETRGQRAGSFENDRHLMILDGIPIYFARNNKAFTQYDMPLLNVENVSFLKGPGSALYGVSAFYGVLDLKTLSLEEDGFHAQSKLSYGSDDFEKRTMHSLNHKDESGEFKLGLTLFNKLPSDDELGINRYNWDQNNSVFFNTSYDVNAGKLKGFSVGYLSSKRKTGIGEFWASENSSNNFIEWTTNVFYSKFKKKLSDKLDLNSYVFFNQSIEEGGFQGFPKHTPLGGGNAFGNYRRTTSNAQASAEIKSDFNKHSLIVGFNFDIRLPTLAGHSTNGRFLLGDSIDQNSSFEFENSGDLESITTFSLYAQEKFKLNFLEGLLFTLGARNDYGFSNSFAYNQLSPRAGLVQRITKSFNAKLLFGSALRTPNIKIVGINNETNGLIETYQPNSSFRASDPQAEIIQSIDFGFNYTAKKMFFEGTMFYNIASNQITRRSYTSFGDTNTQRDDLISLNYVTNSAGNVNTLGYELNLKYIPINGTQLFANYSYALAEDLTEDAHLSFKFAYIPIAKTNLGVSSKIDSKGKFRVSGIYKLIHGFRETKTENTEAFHSIDLNFIIKPISKLSFEFQLLDLFDSENENFSNGVIIPSRGRRYGITMGFTI